MIYYKKPCLIFMQVLGLISILEKNLPSYLIVYQVHSLCNSSVLVLALEFNSLGVLSSK